jgi:precorrin-6A/cobalt-precorrin-6A reductase
MRPLQLLILGGSSEASALARALAGDPRYAAQLSLAGRTEIPAPSPVPVRIGGFGGAEGLARFLAEQHIDLLVDATHPFAVQMKINAIEAARMANVPLLAVRRAAWIAQEGDNWIEVADMQNAALALGEAPKRVFLTVGRQELAPFRLVPQHDYLLRSVDAPPPEALPPRAEVIAARGPFSVDDELELLRTHRTDRLVTKNSGGEATAAKLEAARIMNLPVVMVRRPLLPLAPASVETVAEALHWVELQHQATTSA